MKTKYILKGLLAMSLLVVFAAGCESYNEAVLTDIGAVRELSPLELKASIKKQTTVELNWTVSEDADHYVVEIAAGDPEFKTIFKTLEVNAAELPLQVVLEGETVYSIRVKAVSSRDKEDSKWSVITATTLSEQLFLAGEFDDILGKEVTLRWIPNSSVSKIELIPTDPTKAAVTHTITAEEKESGVATVTGLSSLSLYTADLYNNTSRRGSQKLETDIDLSDGIEVGPTDDLAIKVANAASNDILILKPGDYTSQISTIVLAKGVTIRGLRKFDKPKLKLTFNISPGVIDDVNLINLNLTGAAGNKIDVLRYAATGNYGNLLISGCIIHDYDRTFIGANSGFNANIKSIIVDNSVVTNVGTLGTGSFIDFRAAFADKIEFRKSTFNNCVPGAAFIRSDNPANPSPFGAVTTDILIENCTLYGVTNTIATSGLQILYVRFVDNAAVVRNSIFAATAARYANQSTTNNPTFENNNYFNASTLNVAAPLELYLRTDTAGTALDPQFVNAASGDFTIKNQVLIGRKVGDPRWIKE